MPSSITIADFKSYTLRQWDEVDKYNRSGWIFRGHVKAEWLPESSLERLCDRIKVPSEKIPIIERIIVAEFKRRYHQYANDVPEIGDNLEWLSIMQHHGAPTRLLDFTYSMFIALYFALERANDDAAVWAVNAEWTNNSQGKTILERAGCTSKEAEKIAVGPAFTESEGLFKDVFLNRTPPIELALTVCPRRLTQRMTVQKGVFVCPGNVRRKFIDNIAMEGFGDSSNLIRLVIPKDKTLEYLKHLNDMNISRTSLFPGLDGFASSLGVFHHEYGDGTYSKSSYSGEEGASVWGG